MEPRAPAKDELVPVALVQQKFRELSRVLRERSAHWERLISDLKADIDPWRGTEMEQEFQVAAELLERFEDEVGWLNELALMTAPTVGSA